MMPIYNHRTIVGYAKTEKQAIRVVRGLLQFVPSNWKVTVARRNTDLIDLPSGWIYSVHP